jgi:hypothetical protein
MFPDLIVKVSRKLKFIEFFAEISLCMHWFCRAINVYLFDNRSSPVSCTPIEFSREISALLSKNYHPSEKAEEET